jgi:hypothetical protein
MLVHTYIPTYLHTYIPAYVCMYVPALCTLPYIHDNMAVQGWATLGNIAPWGHDGPGHGNIRMRECDNVTMWECGNAGTRSCHHRQ